MDFNKVKIIKNYTDQIRGFRNLDKYKNLSNNKFSIEMKLLFPEFSKNNNLVFDSIINNQDLEFLDIMFHKLDEINMEYKSRKNELVYLCSKVDDIKALFEVNKDMNKEKLITYIENSSAEFINKYPVIIDRLLDKETRHLDAKSLLFDQIKYKYETQIGEILAQKYVYPKINK